MRGSPIFFICIIMCVLNSCTYQHTAERTAAIVDASGINGKTNITRQGKWVLEPSSRIYVAMPRSSQKVNPLHQQLTMNLGRGFEQNFAELKLGSAPLDLEGALKEARSNACSYMIYPRLVAVKDGISSLQEVVDSDENFYQDEDKTFGLDRLTLQLQIYNANTGEFLDRMNIESQSAWLAIYTNNPEQLMKTAFEQASTLLVRRSP